MNMVLSGSVYDDEDDLEDKINTIIEGRKMVKNASYFAFTATPKNKTLEMFGKKERLPDGTTKPEPHYVYTMKQAIEEGFIMDVLRHFTPVQSYYKLAKTIEDDPKFDKKRAQRLLRYYVESNQYAIHEKANIMVEHFHTEVIAKGKVGGKARAMVITSSIKRAIEYYKAVSKLLEERKSPFKAIVAFSGSVEYEGKHVTEADLNGFPSAKIEKTFKGDPYRIINEFYVKDSSKKVKAVMKQKGESGEYLTTNPPYGYMKDPDNPKRHWIVDDEAAAVVRHIFAWCMEGFGPSQIAKKLKEAKVDCPTVHWMKMGRNAPAKTPDNPYDWAPRTITGILERWNTLVTWSISKPVSSRTEAKRNSKTLKTNGRFSRTPMKPLLTKKPLPVCRSFARTNADPPEQARPICSPVSSAVPIAVRNCTTVPATVLKPDKITLYAPLPVKRARRSATLTSSELWCWKKVHFNT